MTLEFDEPTHTYRLDGVVIPSVSQVLREAGVAADYSSVSPAVLARAAARGAYVDQCCALDDQGRLDMPSVHEECVPYVLAWRKFRAESKFLPAAWQTPVFHPALRYAGTFDCAGAYANGLRELIDIKCTWKLSPSYRLQTAGYSFPGVLTADGDAVTVESRAVVQLKRDGTYKYDKHDDARDYDGWAGAVALYQWKSRLAA